MIGVKECMETSAGVAEERADAELTELLDRDRHRWSPDAGRAHDDRCLVGRGEMTRELPVGREVVVVVEAPGDLGDPRWIAGEDADIMNDVLASIAAEATG
jgi:hypothetical protein